jgi:hypothetical protein
MTFQEQRVGKKKAVEGILKKKASLTAKILCSNVEAQKSKLGKFG